MPIARHPVAGPSLPGAASGDRLSPWAHGDYAVIGATLAIVAEQLVEAADVRAGEKVLDVAAGTGNAALAAARRYAHVTATDPAPALLEQARERARAEALPLCCQAGGVEALPFADASFDAVVSTFGVMFVADHDRAAAEMLRVCRPGGKIGMANWTPDGFIGRLFKIDRATMLGITNALSRRGLIERRPAPDHGRRIGLHLTAAGKSLLAEAKATVATHEDWVKSRFTPAEIETIIALMSRFQE